MENQGLNSSQGWEEEKTKGWIIAKGGKKRKPRAVIKAKGGKSNTSLNNHPGGCIRQVRVCHKVRNVVQLPGTVCGLKLSAFVFLQCSPRAPYRPLHSAMLGSSLEDRVWEDLLSTGGSKVWGTALHLQLRDRRKPDQVRDVQNRKTLHPVSGRNNLLQQVLLAQCLPIRDGILSYLVNYRF